MKNNDLQSRTIDVLRFVLIVYVVLIHDYTSTRGIIDLGEFPAYRFFSFLISLEAAQVAVPAFFFISGFLFFLHRRPYKEKIKREGRSLIIPYILWNGLILLLYLLLESIPALRQFLSGNNPPVGEYRLIDLVRAFWDGGSWDGGNGTPILHQFWYLRNLIILSLTSPLVALIIRWTRWVGPTLLIIAWMFYPGQAFLIESIALFTAGAWFSLGKRDFLTWFRSVAKPVYMIYPLLVIANMVLRDNVYFIFLDRLGFLSGVVFTANLTAYFISAADRRAVTAGLQPRQSYAPLRPLSFFIFALHDPMLTFVKRAVMKASEPLTDMSLTAIYFITPLLVIGICIGIYRFMARYMQPVLKVMTGR